MPSLNCKEQLRLSAKPFLLFFSTEVIRIWGWVNDYRLFIFGWSISKSLTNVLFNVFVCILLVLMFSAGAVLIKDKDVSLIDTFPREHSTGWATVLQCKHSWEIQCFLSMDFREEQILTTLITLGLKSELFCFCFESECEIHIVHDNKAESFFSLFFSTYLSRCAANYPYRWNNISHWCVKQSMAYQTATKP